MPGFRRGEADFHGLPVAHLPHQDYLGRLSQRGAKPAREADKIDAEFALMAGELLRLLPAIVAAMGGELARTPDLIDNAKEQA